MSELILMLIITVLICGGVPYLAISYVNGKIKFPNTKTSSKKLSNSKALLLTALILGTFFNCFLFPVYNFTECSTHGWRWHNIFIAIFACFQIGLILAGAFPYKKGSAIKTIFALLGVNCIYIFAGLGCRYLLEFGEVSNTYNFTTPNIIVHLLAVNALCLASWCFVIAQQPAKTN